MLGRIKTQISNKMFMAEDKQSSFRECIQLVFLSCAIEISLQLAQMVCSVPQAGQQQLALQLAKALAALQVSDFFS